MNNLLFPVRIAMVLLLFFGGTLSASAFAADVTVNSGKESINAIEGVVKVPQNIQITNIETGRSAILIWIEEPELDTETRTIRFSGISPGGFSGIQPLFTLVGEFGRDELRNFAYSDISALRNDGTGGEVSANIFMRESEAVEDNEAPEPFEPIISRSSEIFEGKRFISFLAQDKGTGIERYEKASTWILSPNESDWEPVSSPAPLIGSDLFKLNYIRAVDHAGNYRVVVIHGPYQYATLLSGIILIAWVLLFARRSFR